MEESNVQPVNSPVTVRPAVYAPRVFTLYPAITSPFCSTCVLKQPSCTAQLSSTPFE